MDYERATAAFDNIFRPKPTPNKCYIFIVPSLDDVNGIDTVIGYGVGPDPQTAFNQWREMDTHRNHLATGTIEALQFLPGPTIITIAA